jgi:hypothetical protein
MKVRIEIDSNTIKRTLNKMRCINRRRALSMAREGARGRWR